MARIRTIKPGFFRHEDLFESERETGLPLRVAFAGLWTACDREGRFIWSARQLKLDCLPYDDVDFSRVLDALWTRGFIEKYAVGGKEFGFVPSWQIHQIINNREQASTLPKPNENNTLTRPSRAYDALVTRHGNCQGEGKGREQEGKGTEIDDADDASRAAVASWRQSEAFAIAQEIASIAGQSGEFKESGWGGSTYRVQQWLADGWQREYIIASVKEQTSRRKGRAPPNTIQFFEKGIADFIVRQGRPLPVGEIPRGAYEVSTKSGLAAIDRVFDRVAEVQSGGSAGTNEDAVLSLPARSVSGA